MKHSKWLVVVVLALLAAACSKEKETRNGYKYTVVRKGDGSIAGPGKFVKIELLFKDGKDSVWSDSRKEEFPLIIPVRDTTGMKQEQGLEEIFRMLSKGDSIVMKLNAKTFFEKMYRQPVPPGVDTASNFTFFIGVKEVMDSAQVRKLSDELMAKQTEKARIQQAEQLAKDTVIIDNYLKEKNINAQKTPSGLRYVVTKAGKGPNAKAGQTASINYAGYLLNGKYFDTSYEKVARANNIYNEARGPYKPYDVQVATGSVIPGWDEVMQLMNKGSKITVYVPSTLAYGARKRSEEIVENSILVFDMEMVDVK
jgi:FKBP-type peptidyl-prolyl cis-trans isomerase FkpA